MKRICLICVVVSLSAFSLTAAGDNTASKPFFDATKYLTTYAGPGRNDELPTDINEVLIGYFGPDKLTGADAPDMWCAALLAVEEANKKAGFNGLPFRLVSTWSENPWGSGVRGLARMAFVDEVWAIIGGIDGPSTHLAEQIVAKARLCLINPASSDKSVNLTNVAWMFSLLPQDDIQAKALAKGLYSHVGTEDFILLSATDHDSHVLTVEFKRALQQYRITPAYHFEIKSSEKNLKAVLDKIMFSDAVIIIAGADDSARIIRELRETGFDKAIFAGPCAGSNRFRQQAHDSAQNVIFPLLCKPNKNSEVFEQKFIRRFGKHTDYLAAHTYDAVNLLITTIKKAGLNRVRICDSLRELNSYKGVTGEIKWDGPGRNTRPVTLGIYKRTSSGKLEVRPFSVD